MSRFVLTAKAKADLRTIALFTQQNWGKHQRNQYIKEFDYAFHLLANNPLAGKTCDEIKSGFRKFPQGSHLIFYKKSAHNEIEIVRILHKSVDIETKF